MKNSKDTSHTSKEIVEEMKSLVGEAETMIADSLSEHTAEALANLRERFTAAQERFNVYYDGAKKKVVEGAKYTDATIRENPYQSLAITLAVGMLVGVLLGRRGGK